MRAARAAGRAEAPEIAEAAVRHPEVTFVIAHSQGDGEDIGAIGGDAAFEDCAGAIEWIRGLIEQYDSIAEVPVADSLEAWED